VYNITFSCLDKFQLNEIFNWIFSAYDTIQADAESHKRTKYTELSIAHTFTESDQKSNYTKLNKPTDIWPRKTSFLLVLASVPW